MTALESSLRALAGLPLAELHLAYLDPGSGAMLLQMLLAGAAGVAIFVKYLGRRFLGIFGLKRKGSDASSDSPGDEH